jgi:hypothetical protein
VIQTIYIVYNAIRQLETKQSRSDTDRVPPPPMHGAQRK